ncbi:ribonuclease pancreatic-like [Pelodiscus sinensis]|uniref:ribonuclease pancreatic-like n=1 Tax=Pelodiscus sinensis TaxID=13735 RepID=UPI003F6CEB1D
MARQGPRPALLLPLVLLAAGLAQLGEGATYQDFVNRHVDYEKTPINPERLYCDRMMQRRGMAGRTCKPTNTFLHAPEAQLQAICGRGGHHVPHPRYDNLYESNDVISGTLCTEAPGSRPNDCKYRESPVRSRVTVGCVRGRPVHLQA